MTIGRPRPSATVSPATSSTAPPAVRPAVRPARAAEGPSRLAGTERSCLPGTKGLSRQARGTVRGPGEASSAADSSRDARASTVSAAAGATRAAGLSVAPGRFSRSIDPQSGAGGCGPRPSMPKAAANCTAMTKRSTTSAEASPATDGRTSRTTIETAVSPRQRAAST
ncbi:hypothetical protein GCM10020001_111590 [Nonomuraea salmonea]